MPCQKSIVSRKTMVRMNNPTSTCLSLFIPRLLLFQSFLVRIFHRHDVGPLLHKRIQNNLVKPGGSFVKHWVPYKPDGRSSFEVFAPQSAERSRVILWHPHHGSNLHFSPKSAHDLHPEFRHYIGRYHRSPNYMKLADNGVLPIPMDSYYPFPY